MRLFDKPLTDREHPTGLGGSQRLYRFPNGWGASVVQSPSDRELWDIAQIRWTGPGEDDFEVRISSHRFRANLAKWVTEKEVERELQRIKGLWQK